MHRQVIRSILLFSTTFAALAGIASGQMLGNPVSDMKSGQWAGGIAITSTSRNFKSESKVDVVSVCGSGLCTKSKTISGTDTDTWNHMTLFGEYGISNRSSVRFDVGTVNLAGDSGTAFGGLYRLAVGEGRQLKDKPLQLGLIAAAHTGTVDAGSGVSVSYTDFTGGFGGSVDIKPELRVYAAAVVNVLNAKVDKVSGTISNNNPLGVYGGVDYSIDKDFLVGAEYHLLYENGPVAYGKMKF